MAEFKDAFKAFMELHTETKDVGFGRGLLPAAVGRDGVSREELQAATDRVARAAGRASAAPGLTRMYIGVTGFPEPVDPISAWRTVTTSKPLLEPGDVLDSAEQILGRLEALTDKAEAELPPTTGVEAMHPTIWGAARKLWLDGHFRLAVQSAAENLTSQVKTRTGLANMDATNVYEKVFTAKSPMLTWPGDPSDRTVSSMQNGLSKYAPGLNMTVRNTATHAAFDEMTAQQALERLAALASSRTGSTSAKARSDLRAARRRPGAGRFEPRDGQQLQVPSSLMVSAIFETGHARGHGAIGVGILAACRLTWRRMSGFRPVRLPRWGPLRPAGVCRGTRRFVSCSTNI